MIRQEVKLSLIGFFLGLGSPMGWFLVHVMTRNIGFSFQEVVSELTTQRWLYTYLTLGTVASFSTFGYVVGFLMRRGAEKELVIEAKNQDYMRILGFVSHELRNPLTVVKGRLDLMLGGKEGALSPELRMSLAKARRSCNQMNEMIWAYLNLSRIERGEMMIRPRDLELMKDVLVPVVEELQGNLEIQGMKVAFVGAAQEKKYFLRGDPEWLKVAFRNLLSNAIRYGFENTTIEIRLKEAESHWRVEVHNEGYGILPDYWKKIFEKFGRAPQMGASAIYGTGLGLYIVREVVEQHRGEIRCESEPGKWANFILTLPKWAG